jgi:hypothetical protein
MGGANTLKHEYTRWRTAKFKSMGLPPPVDTPTPATPGVLKIATDWNSHYPDFERLFHEGLNAFEAGKAAKDRCFNSKVSYHVHTNCLN